MKTEVKLSMLEAILSSAKKNGASEAEVIESTWTENPINFENNKLKTLESNQNSGIAIRLIKNKKIGTSSTTDPNAFEKIVSSAIEASEFGPASTFELSKENLAGRDAVNRISTNDLPLENLVEKGTNVIENLRKFHNDLLVSGGFNLSYGETTYLNSHGVFGKRTKSTYSTNFSVQLIRGEDFLGIYDGNSGLEGFPDEKKTRDKILANLSLSKELIPIKTQTYTVIFTPRAVSSIFSHILSVILNGKMVQQKISPLTDKLGKELFDKKLSFIEDPSIGTQKADFDDEGIKTTRKVLIKEGAINDFYFDLSSGSKNIPHHASTGNGFKASLGSSPAPALTTIQIKEGKTLYKDMIKNIKEGVLVDQVLGAGQSNTLAGEFSIGIDLGFKIKDGNIQGRVKNCMIAGNIFNVLQNIEEISSDREWVYGAELLPAFLIENMLVASK